MQLDLILRGQSNAILLAELDHYAGAVALVREVERLLGFDGVADRVTLVHERDGPAGNTSFGGTAFLGDWMVRTDEGWGIGPLEGEFLRRMARYRDTEMGDATAVVWMHSEYDSRDATLDPAQWMAAVRTDAGATRGLLGRDAPYLFVAAQPYGGGTDAGHQAIRLGMESLAAEPGFNARIAARAPDIDLSYDNLDGNWDTREYGGAHITEADALLIALRIARVAAEGWAQFARPGSPVAEAGGNIASDGPRVVSAWWLDPATLQVNVAHDAAGAFAALGAAAASGMGWSARWADGGRLEAEAAWILDGDSLALRFPGEVSGGAVLHYAWGVGRVAAPDGPGQGNAVTDEAGLPVWTPAWGVGVSPGPWD